MLQGTCHVQVGSGEFYQKESRGIADALQNMVIAHYDEHQDRLVIDCVIDPSDANMKEDTIQPVVSLVLTCDEWNELKYLVDRVAQ